VSDVLVTGTALGAARRLLPETLYRLSFNRFHIAPE
jgi:hypothetical protein